MLHILPIQGDDKTGELGVVATDVLWLDLLNPTSAEVTNVEETVGATLPSLGALSEIETSSRLRNYGGVLYMSTPSAARRPEGAQTTPPLGFVLSADRLITVRFMPLPAFDAVAGKFASSQDAPKSSLHSRRCFGNGRAIATGCVFLASPEAAGASSMPGARTRRLRDGRRANCSTCPAMAGRVAWFGN